jgi:hypothetical protein
VNELHLWPDGRAVLTLDEPISKEAMEALQREFGEMVEAWRDAGRPMILSNCRLLYHDGEPGVRLPLTYAR